MPKNKKKIDVKVSAPVSSTATAKKQNPKVERAVRIAGAIATAAIPVGRGASVLGKVVSAVTKPKMASAGKVVKSKTFTQGPKAKITAKTKKGGTANLTKGTKVKVEYETKGLSVSQQKNVTALTASQKARRGLSTAKGAAAGAIATSGGKNEKATKKKKK